MSHILSSLYCINAPLLLLRLLRASPKAEVAFHPCKQQGSTCHKDDCTPSVHPPYKLQNLCFDLWKCTIPQPNAD